MTKPAVASIAAVLLCPAVLFAADIASSSGQVDIVAPPSDLTIGQFESANLSAFKEGDATLATDLSLEQLGPGSDPGLTAGVVPSGTRVTTFYVHFDPVGTTLASASGSLVFDSDILGLLLLAGDDGPLEQSHAVFGAPGTTYPSDGSGFNNFSNEDFSISADSRTLSVRATADAGIDAMRVFVLNVPEPSSLLLALGCVALGWRRVGRV